MRLLSKRLVLVLAALIMDVCVMLLSPWLRPSGRDHSRDWPYHRSIVVSEGRRDASQPALCAAH